MEHCQVDGCDEPIRAKKLCQLHYGRWIKSGRVGCGPVVHKVQKAKGFICSIDGCEQPVRCRMLCSRHYDKKVKSDTCPTCGNIKNQNSIRCSRCFVAEYEEIDVSKTCSKCKVNLPLDCFGIRTSSRVGGRKRRSRCRACETKEAAERRERHKTYDPEEFEKRCRRNKEREKNAREKMKREDPEACVYRSVRISARLLKLDVASVVEAFEKNGNRCESCGKDCNPPNKRVHIDHDHTTGLFRGFLCGPCNVIAGHSKDSPATLRNVAGYIERKRV